MMTASPCNFCVLRGLNCVKMPGNKNSKCAECTHQGKPCVSLSWASLNTSCNNLREDLAGDEVEWDTLLECLSEVQAHVAHKRKVLEQVEGHA